MKGIDRSAARGGPERYGRPAIVLHWVTAALIIANWLLGLSMVPMHISPRKLQWYLVHKSIGLTVLLLSSLRLGWRAVRPPPPPVAMPRWQRRAASASHALLYVLLFAIPLSGWLYSSATGVQVVYLGVLPLPNLVPKDRALGDALRLVHVSLNALLFVVFCLHVAAAIKHHVVDRDAALVRILPFVKPVRP
ncbi:MAG TPA: cytochrome b [Casimicrobiaceae bacterium]|jgi:cytochrome b561|nr:cytochrome b [Casimicrobiaceae bacterium]HWD36981.1 cytochrome b [Casimicrobiaceae bacterium]